MRLILGDFFAPLNFTNLLVFFAFIFCCEIIGFWLVNNFIGKPRFFLRGAVWLIGLGMVVFTYFLSHYFVSFAFPSILFVLLILSVLSINTYIKSKAWKSLFIFLKNNAVLSVFILPVLPMLFVKISLPPYMWDEMAYHYVSPYTLYFERVWNIGNGLYENLPRLLETAYIALFSLAKSYSLARLLHFSIFMTFLASAYTFLKERFGLVVAIIFFLLVIFHPENFLLWSTFGYIDIAVASFILIGFLAFLDFLFTNTIESLVFSFVFFSLSIGTKYSALIQFISILLILMFILIKRKIRITRYNKKLIFGVILFFVLGGYWYLRNFVNTGNPIYPFLFGCKLDECISTNLGRWTTAFTISNFLNIFSRVFHNNKLLQHLFLISIPLSILHRSIKVKITLFTIFAFIVADFLIVKWVSGYETRFFYHWQFFSVLIISLPLTDLPITNILKSSHKIIYRLKNHVNQKV